MNNGKKTIAAVIIIIVLAAVMAAVAIYNRNRAEETRAKYEAALVEEAEKNAGREAEAQDREARREAASDAVEAAVETYIPGVVFYTDSDMIMSDETGMSSYEIVRSLIVQNIYDIPVETVYVQGSSGDTSIYPNYVPVLFIGNTSFDDADDLIRRQRELIGGRGNYIVLGLPSGTAAERSALEEEMTRAFGDRYINLRDYFSTFGMESLALDISPEDELAMAEGRTPPGLLSEDGLSLNTSGCKLVAFLTYDRMTTLGYFDEVLQAVEAYEDEQNSF